MNIGGVLFRFIDTAGIRHTTDAIETMGIERTYRKVEQASIVLWVIDLTAPVEKSIELASSIAPKLTGKEVILLFNKSDLSPEATLQETSQLILQAIEGILPEVLLHHLFISAKRRLGTEQLQELLVQAAAIPSIGDEEVIVTNLRHYESLTKALDAIRRVKEGLESDISHDLFTQDIRECMFYLGEITGQITTDEVLGNIFSKFCIGK